MPKVKKILPVSKVPIHKLNKKEIVKLASGRCQHGHSYLEHYGCYVPDKVERIGFFDVESSNLTADYGQMLSYCIKDSTSDLIMEGCITKYDLEHSAPGEADKRIVKKCVEDLKKFDKIVTFYGARFDIPFIRTRAMTNGIEFPPHGSIVHKDLWFTIRGKFRLSSNRLENACRVLLGETSKTRIDTKNWHGALQGNKKCLDYILEHNRYDVLDLEKLYNHVEEFGRPVANSI